MKVYKIHVKSPRGAVTGMSLIQRQIQDGEHEGE